jgi:hypothetical protein
VKKKKRRSEEIGNGGEGFTYEPRAGVENYFLTISISAIRLRPGLTQ